MISNEKDTDNICSRLSNLVKRLLDEQNGFSFDVLLDSMESLYYEALSSGSVDNIYTKYHERFGSEISKLNSYRVNIKDFENICTLGQGGFGKIDLVRYKYDKKVYAMKCMEKAQLLSNSQSNSFWEERYIMSSVNCKWLVKLHYAFMNHTHVYLIMDFMQGGDLIGLMSSYDILEEWTQFYIAEACLGVNAIHEMGFVHLDVKPDNMLLDHNGHLKLCDFGTCVKVNEKKEFFCKLAIGTPDYISPEVLRCHKSPQYVNMNTDWWSIGVCLYELLYEEPPFFSDSLVGTYTKISNFESSLKFPNRSSTYKNANNLISNLITHQENRIEFDEIAAHPYFVNKGWNFNNIHNFPAPFIPELQNDEDVSYFDVPESSKIGENTSNSSRGTPVGLKNRILGSQLNFIGFSFNPEFSNVFTINNNDPKEHQGNTNELLSLKDEISNLNNEISKLELFKQDMLKEKEGNISEVKELNVTLEYEKERNLLLNKEVKSLIAEKDINVNELNKYKGEIVQFHEKLSSLEEKYYELDTAKKQIEMECLDFKDKNLKLNKELASVKTMNKVKLDNNKYGTLTRSRERLTNYSKSNSLERVRPKISKAVSNISIVSKYHEPAHSINSSNSGKEIVDIETEKSVKDSPAINEKSKLLDEIEMLNNRVNYLLVIEHELRTKIEDLDIENAELKDELEQNSLNYMNSKDHTDLASENKKLESYCDLYKVQVKQLSEKMEVFKEKINELNNELKKESNSNDELKTSISKLKASAEIEKWKYLDMQLSSQKATIERKKKKNELKVANNNLEKSLQTSENARNELEKKLDSLNSDLKLAHEQILAKDNLLMSYEADAKDQMDSAINNWKNLLNIERMKKDQAIKKLDQLVNYSSLGHQLVTQKSSGTDNRGLKKLQNELRNERMKYENLLAEHHNLQTEGGKKINDLIEELSIQKKENHKLKLIIDDPKNRRRLKSGTYIEQASLDKSAAHTSESSVSGDKLMNQKVTKTISSYQSSYENECVVMEGTVLVMPHTVKTMRKVQWKKHYAKLTNSSFVIFFEKSKSNEDTEIFKSIPIKSIVKMESISYGDIRKVNRSDVPKIFKIIYFDTSLPKDDKSNKSFSALSRKKSAISKQHRSVFGMPKFSRDVQYSYTLADNDNTISEFDEKRDDLSTVTNSTADDNGNLNHRDLNKSLSSKTTFPNLPRSSITGGSVSQSMTTLYILTDSENSQFKWLFSFSKVQS